MRPLCIAVAAFVLLHTPQTASACSCAGRPTPLQALQGADFVFAGRTLGESVMDLQGFIVTEFEVDRIWKGLDGESRVTLTQSYDSCTMIFEPLDEGYLVYGYVGPLHVFDENNDDFVRTEEVYLQPSVCSRGGPLNRAAEDLEALGEPSITSVNAILWAQIKALPVAGWR